MKTLILLIALSLFASCGSPTPFQRGRKVSEVGGGSEKPGSRQGDEDEITSPDIFFERQVQPLLQFHCSQCHSNPITTFEEARNWVVPGEPQESELYQLVQGTHPEHRANQSSGWNQDSKELDLLRDWILALSPEKPDPLPNPHPEPEETKRLFFDQRVLPLLENDCASCHENKAPNYNAALRLVSAQDPRNSLLFTMATGQGSLGSSGRKHFQIWDLDSSEARVLTEWIDLL